jgi:amino acid adenylation domain-containing protein/natural product biosynthesis luciferase-like monooxygenase protein
VWELWGALAYGGRLVVVPSACTRAPEDFYRLLCAEGVTVLNQTPSAFRQLIAAQAAAGEDAHSLRYVIFGGEALELHMLAPWFARNDPAKTRLINMYGITETTVHVTWREIGPADVAAGLGSMIGVPIPDLQLYILDRHLQPVPVGVTGEMYVGGAGVARGYLNRPELTAERFLPNPFGGDPQARLYKTGDLGRWTAGGDIEYLGRNDFQVKIRGFRIELGEIEAKLAACQGVRDAVVLAREDEPGQKRLVAYYVPQAGAEVTAASLRSALSGELADYMVPSAFVALEEWPLTPNGKLDRKALPAPDGDAVAARTYEAPQGEVETALAAIWGEVLQLDRVGRDDHFFELGGHSLMVITLIERLRQQGLRLDVRSVFSAPTLAAMAEKVQTVEAGAGAKAVPPNLIPANCTEIVPEMLPLVQLSQAEIDAIVAVVPGGAANVQDIYPLAPLQEGILFHYMLGGEGDAYLSRSLMSFDSHARMRRMLDALQRVIDRHDILRTGFHWDGLQEPVQVVRRQAQLQVETIDVPAGVPAMARLKDYTDPQRRRLDLQTAPLIAVTAVHDVASGEWLAALLIHHVIDDNYTLQLILAEIEEILEGRGGDLPPSQPYRNFISHTRAVPAELHEAFFREQLGDLDEGTLPFGIAPAAELDGIEDARVELEADMAQRLRRVARQHGVSPAVLFHSAWAHVLARCTGRDDVVFGTVLSGRLQGSDGADRVLGPFINTLPLRVKLAERTVEQVVADTFAQMQELLVHEQAPLALAQRCSGVPASHPLFSTLLNYRHAALVVQQGQGGNSEAFAGMRLLSSEERTHFPIAMFVDDLGDRFSLGAQSVPAIGAQRMVGYLIAAVRATLDALEQDAETPADSIDILSPSEREQVLHAFNATACAYPSETLIHERFEAQAAARPDAAALVCGKERLSYGELNRRANRVAHRLLELGVAQDDVIAICLERSVEMVVGMLGILKAGAGYLPMDSGYPQERLTFLLEDSAPRALLTHSKLRSVLNGFSGPVFTLDEANAFEGWSEQNPLVPGQHARQLACVIYTSGSTGTPKGVMVEHRSVLRLAVGGGYAPLTPDDCVPHCANPAFDASTWEIWAPLLNGAQVLVVPQAVLLEPAAFARALIDGGATAMVLTTALFNEYADGLGEAFGRLQYLLIGGEALDPRTVSKALSGGRAPARLVNVYGPTETTTFATAFDIDAVASDARSIPIGGPIPNTTIYILDQRMQPVPIGVTGELYIGGPGVARGYLNRPELTAERFVADPFGADSQGRLYKTGDLGCWLPGGSIEFQGRNDAQVKIRGFRIELGEIEARLAACDGIRQAVVVARDTPAGGKALAAYAVPEEADTIEPAGRTVSFSIYYFGADTGETQNKYRLVLVSAKFADEHGFDAIWTPERHFHEVGGLYPNPATLSAAMAAITKRIKLRAGSVVLPLHNPIRVAEEWSVVDNISQGRVGLSLASGWHPRDFVLAPSNYEARKDVMLDGMKTLQALWRGEPVAFTDGTGGQTPVRVYPKPVQAELPIWITSAGNPETFIQAGNLGANLLTHMLGQSLDTVAANIRLYREALARSGYDPRSRTVTMMIQTFVGEDFDDTMDRAREPFKDYLRAHKGLSASILKSLNEKSGNDAEDGIDSVNVAALQRYMRTATLIGTAQTCLPVVHQLREIGIDEFACVIDWIDTENALTGLPHLHALQQLAQLPVRSTRMVREQLQAHLPSYMMPSSITFLDALPLTPNGKVDYRALPEPDLALAGAREFEPPQGDIEIVVAQIWCDLLGVSQVGRSDQFFELGGHSLLAVQLVSRLRQTFRADVTLSELFAQPTLEGVAGLVERTSDRTQSTITRADRSKPLPLSWGQQRLWFIAQMDPDASSTYHIPMGMRLNGVLNRRALHAALDRIVERHESLRTGFTLVGGEPTQVIAAPDVGCTLTEHDLRELDHPEQLERITELSRDEMQQAFDLSTGPMIRGKLLILAEREHVLLLTQHHIASDGWSTRALIQEIGLLYAAFDRGEADPLEPLPFQYADYAVWQRNWMQGETLQRQEDFWRGYLAGAPALLELPLDRQRPAVRSHAGQRVAFTLPGELARELRDLSQRHGCTLFMTLLCGWSVLLSRLSGQDDVVIGTPIASRQRTELEPLIGFFANTLALRVQVPADLKVAKLLEQIRTSALGAFAHQDLPFDRVVEVMQPARSLNASPLFQVMLSLNNTPSGEVLTFPELSLSPFAVDQNTRQFDLSMELTDEGDRITGSLSYATDVFEQSTAARMIERFQVLLAGMAADQEQLVGRLPLLEQDERARVLEYSEAARIDFTKDVPSHALFEAHAASSPDAPALAAGDMQWTYGELNLRANRIAHRLIAMGVRPDDRVAICLERGADAIAAILGTLKAGAGYVPLDPTYPAGRLAFMLADCAPVALVSDTARRELLPDTAARLLLLDAEQAELAAQPSHDPDPAALGLAPHHLAYVIYTSGSTGQPKGVMVEHRNLAALAMVRNRLYPERHTLLLLSSLAFDMSVAAIFGTLCGGGELVVAEAHAVQDPRAIGELIERHRVEALLCIPSFAQLLLGHAGDAMRASLKVVIVAGEACPPALVKRLGEAAPGIRLINEYGPTEGTVWASMYACEDADAETVPIGQPIPNTQIYILDRHLQPVPVGVPGELFVGGAGVARGYLNRPELTAERFLPNPFGGDPQARLYKTGDLGRWTAGGDIEYLGRNDFQVKIRGFRIELGEIEAKLAACQGVRDAVVLAREEEPGQKRLVAYYVPQAGAEVTAASLRQALSGELADYMVPSAFVALEEWPLTPNGKLDRKALPAPDGDAVAARTYEAPQGEVETALAAIWGEVLQLERVGRDDHFFELGGHSLLGVRMMTMLRTAFGVDLAVRELFLSPTIAQMAAAIAAMLGADGRERHPNLVPLRPGGTERPLFFVHPGEGETGYVMNLVPWLDSNLPVYGLAATGFVEGEIAHESLVPMARQYIAAIRTVQPHGPYRLAGWSAGGLIAYEMANQLLGEDESVEFLGMIETGTHFPALGSAVRGGDGGRVDYLMSAIPADAAQATILELQSLAEAEDVNELVARFQGEGWLPAGIAQDTLCRHLDVRLGIARGMADYVLAPLSMQVSLFCAEERHAQDISAGWKRLLNGRLQTVWIGGDHYSIVEAPHAEQLGAAIGSAMAHVRDTVVVHAEHLYSPRITIQHGDAGACPLFVVPGAGASVTAFVGLAQALGQHVPVFGLQPRGLCGLLAPHVDVPSAARAYIKAMREVAPKGPYQLLGHSFGGWVAFEIACRLEAEGEEATLFILDSRAPADIAAGKTPYTRQGALLHLVHLLELRAGKSLGIDEAALAGLNHEQTVELLLGRAIAVKLLPPSNKADTIRGMLRVFEANLNTGYAPAEHYAGVVYFASASNGARGRVGMQERAPSGWSQYADEISAWTCSGNHQTMLEMPHVGALGDWLSPLLKNTR